jgi:glutathione synthase/RimK-type ligase-like ATP-grasp enzyme
MYLIRPMPTIYLATCKAYPELGAGDQILEKAFKDRGFRVEVRTWQNCEPAKGDHVFLRQTWDYWHHLDEFRLWIRSLDASSITLWNSSRVIEWNLDKCYLLELEARHGAKLPETHWCSDLKKVEKLLSGAKGSWVLKPSVSADADRTRVVDSDRKREALKLAEEILSLGRTVLMQEFLQEVQTEGEYSVVRIGGTNSHVIRKKPQKGDFRVQPNHGGVSERVIPAPDGLLESVNRVMESVEKKLGSLLYARADLLRVRGEWKWMELELIEPNHFFELAPEAAAGFVKAWEGMCTE